MNASNPKAYWCFLAVSILAIYLSQATGYLDEYGVADALSCALFSVAVLVGASFFGKLAVIVASSAVFALNTILLIGSKFYFDLYQSYVPFSILSLASGVWALMGAFTVVYPILAALVILAVTLAFWGVISRLSFPSNSKLAVTFILLLSLGLALQVYHDARKYKQFHRYSEVPVGYFLRTAELIPLIDGNPLAVRKAKIDVLANSIKSGRAQSVPKSYLDAISALYLETKSKGELYPMQSASENKSNIVSFAQPDNPLDQKNVIVFVLESFRASEMGAYGNLQSVTPFLDSLVGRSLLARKVYSTAPFTVKSETAINCGVFDNFGEEASSEIDGDDEFVATCLPEILVENGYDTFWFHGNTKDFYNRTSYLPTLGFSNILGSEELYGESFFKQHTLDRRRGTKDKPLLGWGIPDPVLFSMALQKLEQTDKPFYAEILSVSNHLPFDWDWGIEFPQDLQPNDTFYENYRRGMFYTDAALKGFFDEFQNSELLDNTIIVITGDHGVWTFDDGQPLTELNKHEQFFRMPLLIYEKGREPAVITQPASHVDIPPTLLSMLGVKADTVFFGRSLVDEPEKVVPIYSLFEASYSFRLNDNICIPRNRCFHNGPECEGYEEAAMTKSEMVCYQDEGEMMFDPRLIPAEVPEQTKTHIDNFLNYAMLGLQIGFVPEKPKESNENSNIVKTPE